MIIRKQIDSVNDFSVFPELVFDNSEAVFAMDWELKSPVKQVEKKGLGLFRYYPNNDFILFDSQTNRIKFYRNFEEIYSETEASVTGVSGNCLLYYSYSTRKIIRVDLVTGKRTETELPRLMGPHFLDSDFILSRVFGNYDSLAVFDLNSGQQLWEFMIPGIELYEEATQFSGAKLAAIAGVHDHIAWIVLTNGFFIGLSVADGSIKHFVKLPANAPPAWHDNKSFAQASKSIFSKEEGKIFGIDSFAYWEMDLNHPQENYMWYDLANTSLQHHNFEVKSVVAPGWQGQEIFAGQQEFANQPSFVGIFNRDIKEFTWTSHELETQVVFKGLRKVALQGNRFYVLDAENILHIMEREK